MSLRAFSQSSALATFIWLSSALFSVAANEARFEEVFSTNVPADWQKVESGGMRLEAKMDGLHFNGPEHALAHFQRKVEGDLITVSARIAQWGSVYLIWDDQNWYGAGQISPTPFGRIFSAVTANGTGDEEDHRGIDFGLARWVQIQLGEKFVRFSWSNDGEQWTELRVVRRTRAFSGAPKWLAAGKYYQAEDVPFSGKAAVSKVQGDKIGGRILEVRVENTPPSKSQLSSAELKQATGPHIDPVTKWFATTKADPGYEAIVHMYPPMKSPREVVGVPGHPLDIGVDRLGRFDVSPWSRQPVAWFEVGNPPQPIGKEGAPFRRRLLNGFLPIDTLELERDGVKYALTIFGWSEEFSVDQPLYAFAQAKITAANKTELPGEVALVAPGGKRVPFEVHNAAGSEALVSCRFKYPEPESATAISSEEFEAKKKVVASFWENKLAPATHFEVPERRVMEAYRAWLTYSLLNADTINGFIEPHDGAGFYEEMFGNSVSVHSMAMDAYGLHDYVERILDTQRHFQQSNGLYTQVCGLTDPGGFLCGLARHYRMTGNASWLETVRPSILKQCDWIIDQRTKAPTSGVSRGLIKFRPYNDYVAEVYNYLGNVWCAQGLSECAAALKGSHPGEANRLHGEAAKYRDDILASMAMAAFKHNGQTLLPLEPETHRLLKLERYKAAGYYSLSASPLLGIGFLPPDDKRANWIVDALEKRGGLIAGVCEFETGIDHAYTYGYLLNELKRGEARKAVLGFYSMLAFGMTRDTYSPVEVTMIETGENHYTLPHLYSCTEQLRLLRALLIREDGNELRLGEGIPHQWLEPGKRIKVKSAPTEFGPISYEIQPRSEKAYGVHIEPPRRTKPSRILLTIRRPGENRIRKVDSTGEVGLKIKGQTLILENLTGPTDFTVHY